MPKETIAYIGKLPEGAGKALKQVIGSTIAGVGDTSAMPGYARPTVQDHTSREAFEQYKEFNTQTNLRTNEKRMWGMTLEKVAGYLLSGMALAIGVALLDAAKGFGTSTLGFTAGGSIALAGAVGIGAMVAVSLGVFYAFSQAANRQMSDKHMDVDDFRLKRQAGLIAEEIKKSLQEDRELGKDMNIITIDAPDATPKTQLPGDARQLEARVMGHHTIVSERV